MFNVITHPTALDELLELPDNLRGRMARLIERLEQEGNKMKMPHSRVCQRQDYWPFWGCGRFPGLLYHSSPHCWRYILGLTAPGDNFIRRSLYHLM